MTIKMCDVCGERMTDCGNTYQVTELKYTDAGGVITRKWSTDICPSCNNKLKEKLKEMGVSNL